MGTGQDSGAALALPSSTNSPPGPGAGSLTAIVPTSYPGLNEIATLLGHSWPMPLLVGTELASSTHVLTEPGLGPCSTSRTIEWQ